MAKETSKLRLGVAQITSTDNLVANLKLVSEYYLKAAQQQADMVVFPENSLYFRIRAGSVMVGPTWMGPEIIALGDLVSRHGTSLMLTTALPGEGEKFRNATLFFQPGEQPKVVYSKIHLFDVDVPGAPSVRESDHFESGHQPTLIEFRGWKIGLSICYDLRFAELYSHYAQKADLILVPSAFLVPTGKAHWHVLLRARAIENQAFVVAPAQTGAHGHGTHVRHTFGHSLVVDPWGRVIEDLAQEPRVKIVEIQKDEISKVRQQIPMSQHRRL